jgi:ADP-heptose:LPS heptosyltransferase
MKPEEMITEKYLWASDESREKWKWVKESKKLKVGVRFIGNKRNNQLLYRHIELNNMMNFLHETFKGYDVEYYSLQKGDGEEEVRTCSELIDVADQINSFDDTIALIENLDIVISTCTSVVHIAGAVGTKTIVFVPIAAYFTYLTKHVNRPPYTSLWYGDNFRFFRQTKPKVWDEPMIEAKDYIRTYLEHINE